MSKTMSRREFVNKSGHAAMGMGAGALLASHLVRGSLARAAGVSASEKIVLGVIGCGGQGQGVMREFIQTKMVEVGAVCDVDSDHANEAAQRAEEAGRKPRIFKDFRKLLEMKEIDCVLIATPDHWHALTMIHACEAGKDIYLEKPISHNIVEGRMMVNAAKKYGRIVQVGTWQRSVGQFIDAIDYVRSGKLGTIQVCRAWFVNPLGGWLKSIGHQKPQTPPPNLDWDLWLGPAPKVPYTPNRCHFEWRWFFDYGGGLATDWGVHMIDIVLLGMQVSRAPLAVTAVGGNYALDDDRDTPDTMVATFQYPNFVLTWENRFANGRGLDGGGGHGSEFVGSKGTLIVDREKFQFFPEGDNKDQPEKKSPGFSHVMNLLECMKTRQQPRSNIESMHLTTKVCHLANIAYRTRKRIEWDDENERITNDSSAMRCESFKRKYRKPWRLPKVTV